MVMGFFVRYFAFDLKFETYLAVRFVGKRAVGYAVYGTYVKVIGGYHTRDFVYLECGQAASEHGDYVAFFAAVVGPELVFLAGEWRELYVEAKFVAFHKDVFEQRG